MADRKPYILWPGIAQPVNLTYCLSQGITPGSAILRFLPQDASKIALQGDLVFGDGVGTVRLRDCKINSLRTSMDPESGRSWSVDILDRRWKWTSTGVVAGAYNVPDATRDVTRPPEEAGPYLTLPRYYVPWTTRNPHDLIKQCLAAMGERRYQINAPNVAYPLPAMEWDYANPAQMLSQLCEMLGCRIVYRPDVDGVWIVPIGKGADLPAGGPGVVYRDSPGIKTPSRPDSLLLVGAPVKYQVEWILEAVGEEWDGSLKPINALSYAPPDGRVRHQVDVTPTTVANATNLWIDVIHKGVTYEIEYVTLSTSVADATAGLTNALVVQLVLLGFDITDQSTYVKIVGPANGEGFKVETSTTGASKLKWELKAQGVAAREPWSTQAPMGQINLGRDQDEFNLAGLTKRLTYAEALDKAQRSVFRYYRITNVDPESGKTGVRIPEYGTLDDTGGIYRVILLDEQLDQPVPVPQDELVFRADGLPVARDFYDGLFRWKPARCFGRYHRYGQGGLYKSPTAESVSEPGDEVLIDFQIVAERALLIFSAPVFLYDPTNGTRPAQIRLRCACNLRAPVTNNIVRFTYQYDFPGPKLGTKPAVIHHHDVERLVKCTYQAFWPPDKHEEFTLERNKILTNDQEVIARANYYLTAAALRYQTPQSGERQYNGVIPVYPDGAIQQVSWIVDVNSGADTVASRNSEHFIYAPQYPERLRWEYLGAMLNGPGGMPGQAGVPTPQSMGNPNQ